MMLTIEDLKSKDCRWPPKDGPEGYEAATPLAVSFDLDSFLEPADGKALPPRSDPWRNPILSWQETASCR